MNLGLTLIITFIINQNHGNSYSFDKASIGSSPSVGKCVDMTVKISPDRTLDNTVSISLFSTLISFSTGLPFE